MSNNRRTPQRNQDYLSRIITLGEVTDESACEVIGLIHEINREDGNKDVDKREVIKLIINSFGGSVYEGMGIIDTIETSLTPIHTYIYGNAMSMAFAIATCGHYRYAGKRATFMYHELSWSTNQEKLKFHEQEVRESKRIWAEYDNIIVENTKIPLKILQKTVKEQREWYMTAAEALELGIIDEVLG